jgi:hypothetical protein
MIGSVVPSGSPRLRRRPSARRAANCSDEAGEVLSARSARLEVRGDAWKPAFGVLASHEQLAVYVQQLQGGLTSDIPRIGRQEALELSVAVAHRDSCVAEFM